MATLSLKKPQRAKLIGNSPLNDLFGKFAVMRQSKRAKSMRFTCIHESIDLANIEASRLSKSEPEERFLILQVVGQIERGV